MPSYQPQDYWDRLHAEAPGERAVGYPGLAVSLNRAMYEALVAETRRMLRAHGLLDAPGRVLDVGAGTGIWIDFWQRAGAREIAGVDLAQGAVDALAGRFPQVPFAVVDISGEQPPAGGPFDLVSAMSVLLHVVDPGRWAQALRNLAALLAPGGHAVLCEPVVVHRWWGPPADAASNSRVRSLDEWRAGLAQADLELVDLRPATVLLSNVVDTRSRYAFAALWRYWGLLQQLVGTRERAGRVAGAVLGAADAPLRRLLPHGPSAKLMLLRRTAP